MQRILTVTLVVFGIATNMKFEELTSIFQDKD